MNCLLGICCTNVIYTALHVSVTGRIQGSGVRHGRTVSCQLTNWTWCRACIDVRTLLVWGPNSTEGSSTIFSCCTVAKHLDSYDTNHCMKPHLISEKLWDFWFLGVNVSSWKRKSSLLKHLKCKLYLVCFTLSAVIKKRTFLVHFSFFFCILETFLSFYCGFIWLF